MLHRRRSGRQEEPEDPMSTMERGSRTDEVAAAAEMALVPVSGRESEEKGGRKAWGELREKPKEVNWR